MSSEQPTNVFFDSDEKRWGFSLFDHVYFLEVEDCPTTSKTLGYTKCLLLFNSSLAVIFVTSLMSQNCSTHPILEILPEHLHNHFSFALLINMCKQAEQKVWWVVMDGDCSTQLYCFYSGKEHRVSLNDLLIICIWHFKHLKMCQWYFITGCTWRLDSLHLVLFAILRSCWSL